MKKCVLILAGILTFITLVPCWATEENTKHLVVELEEITVTGTKRPSPLKESPAFLKIKTAQELDSHYNNNLADGIEDISAIKVEKYGYMGQGSAVLMRGLVGNKVLVLVDGRPINAPSTGDANLSEISLDNVERIEVVKGPYSGLYGANAIGGVINVITKSPPVKPATKLTSTYGSWNTFTELFEHGNSIGDFGYLINTNFKKTNGPRDNSKYETENGYIKVRYGKPENNIEFTSGYYRDRVHNPGTQPAEDFSVRTDTQKRLGSDEASNLFDFSTNDKFYLNGIYNLYIEGPLRARELKVRGYLNDWVLNDHREWTEAPVHQIADDKFETDMRGAEVQATFEPIDDDFLTVGFGSQNDIFEFQKRTFNEDKADVSTAYLQVDRTTIWGYLQNELKFGLLTLNLAARLDDPTDFKRQASPKVGALLKVMERISLKGSFGKAFRAPALNDLYWPSDPFAEGNRNLRPEKSDSYEVGIEMLPTDRLLLSVSAFTQKVDHLIAWAPTGTMGPYGPRWHPANVNKVRTNGIEADVKVDCANWISVRCGYTFLDTYQRNSEVIDYATNEMKEIKRPTAFMPKHKIDGWVSMKDLFKVKGLCLDLHGQYISKTYNYYSHYGTWPDTSVTMDAKEQAGYFVSNAKISKAFKNFETFLACDNIFDKKYAKFGGMMNDRGYPQPGRNFTIGVKASF